MGSQQEGRHRQRGQNISDVAEDATRCQVCDLQQGCASHSRRQVLAKDHAVRRRRDRVPRVVGEDREC